MTNIWKIVIGVVVIGLVSYVSYQIGYDKGTVILSPEYSWRDTVDSLTQVLESIKLDTAKINESNKQIDTIYVRFKQEYADRVTADIQSDVDFWTEYTSLNYERLSDSIYSITAKDN